MLTALHLLPAKHLPRAALSVKQAHCHKVGTQLEAYDGGISLPMSAGLDRHALQHSTAASTIVACDSLEQQASFTQ